jgi:Uma2 family endonuclease
MTVAKDQSAAGREVVFERDGYRYYRVPRPLHFPSEEKVPEGKQHLELRTALYQILQLAFGSMHGIGSDQFVYWDATDPRLCLAPDAFVRLGGPNDVFRVWKVWERGAPHVAVEIISATERDMDQEAQLSRYRQMGVAELVRFDCDDVERPLRVWDRTDDDLVERALEQPTSAECKPLGIFWVVVDDLELGRALRPARDPEGRDLLPTPVEQGRRELARAQQEHAREREEAERRIRELEEQLRRRSSI